MNDYCFMCKKEIQDKFDEIIVKQNISLNGQVIKAHEFYYKVCNDCVNFILDKPKRFDKLFKKC